MKVHQILVKISQTDSCRETFEIGFISPIWTFSVLITVLCILYDKLRGRVCVLIYVYYIHINDNLLRLRSLHFAPYQYTRMTTYTSIIVRHQISAFRL